MLLKLIKNTVIIFIAVCIAGCGSKVQSPKFGRYSEARTLMGTIIKVDVCYAENQKGTLDIALKEVWARLQDIHWRMSIFNDKSDVSKINRSYQSPVEVGADTYQVIEDAIEFSKLTQGAFDITAGPLIEFWKASAKYNTLPQAQEIQNIRDTVGTRYIGFKDGHFIQLLNEVTRIDLGGIAKGYGVDEAARILRENRFVDFLIDAGGDLYAGGKNCEGKLWKIGIQSPGDKERLIDIVELTDAAVTTSGNYEQFYEIGGIKWSHIVNPITGYPQKDVVSATVIAPTAEEADALSTALCVLDPQQGYSLIDSLGDRFASMVIVLKNNDQEEKIESRQFGGFRVKFEE